MNPLPIHSVNLYLLMVYFHT